MLNLYLVSGAIDEESFVHDFDTNLPTLRLSGPRDVEDQMNQIEAVISNESKDWEERTKSVICFFVCDCYYNTP